MQEAHVNSIDSCFNRMHSPIPTAPTRSRNTRRARTHSTPRESAVTIVSSRVMVVKLSPSSTRRCVCLCCPYCSLSLKPTIHRPRPQRRLCCGWNARCASSRLSWLSSDASSTPRLTILTLSSGLTRLFSFELGGEKKTKGAAIQFVSADHAYCPTTCLTIHLVSTSVIIHVFHCFFCPNIV